MPNATVVFIFMVNGSSNLAGFFLVFFSKLSASRSADWGGGDDEDDDCVS